MKLEAQDQIKAEEMPTLIGVQIFGASIYGRMIPKSIHTSSLIYIAHLKYPPVN